MTFCSRSRSAIALAALAVLGAASPTSAQQTTTYGYDAQGQVTAVVRGGASTRYTYDNAGNRVKITAAQQALGAFSGGSSAKSAVATAPSVAADTAPVAVYDGVVVLCAGQVLSG